MRHSWFLVLAACGRVGFDDVERADAPVDAPPTCPAAYEALGGSCYRFTQNVPSSGSWLDNEATCEADGVGAHLVVIDDAAELALVVDELRARGTVDAAIGLSDRILEGDYRTVTGSVAFLVWAPANPDGDNDCGSLASNVADTGMKDSSCTSESNDYICEYDGIAADPTAF